eukprot:COSAG01_NODE_2890_length_6906_cov_23.470545_9_plen_343_part_00
MADEGFVDITGDGGILKKVLTEGEGDVCPTSGVEVEVHYVGTLHDGGEKFDSSRDRDDTFKFQIGKGSVIKGWDQGVAGMKVGEKAILRCASDYAYGDNGSPPKIPGGATLDFEVELFGWEEKMKEPWEMDIDEKIATATKCKEVRAAHAHAHARTHAFVSARRTMPLGGLAWWEPTLCVRAVQDGTAAFKDGNFALAATKYMRCHCRGCRQCRAVVTGADLCRALLPCRFSVRPDIHRGSSGAPFCVVGTRRAASTSGRTSTATTRRPRPRISRSRSLSTLPQRSSRLVRQPRTRARPHSTAQPAHHPSALARVLCACWCPGSRRLSPSRRCDLADHFLTG